METEIKEKHLKGTNGWFMLIAVIAGFIAAFAMAIVGFAFVEKSEMFFALAIAGIILMFIVAICLNGFKILAPNEAVVLTLFGKYHGTQADHPYTIANPYCTAKKPTDN